MGGPKARTLPGAPGGRQNVQTQDASVCHCAQRCHVNGSGITKFCSAFPQPLVKKLAKASALIVDASAGPYASGTLIRFFDSTDTLGQYGVVLMAAHSFGMGSPSTVKMFDVIKAGDASGGSWESDDSVGHTAKWTAGQVEGGTVDGVVERVLEIGDAGELDYAMVLVRWPNDKESLTRLLDVDLPSAGNYLGNEVVVIGHPGYVKGYSAQSAQAAAGGVRDWGGENFESNEKGKKNKAYSSAYLPTSAFTTGMSGGGVFNTSGELVGVEKGVDADRKHWFLNLAAAAEWAGGDSRRLLLRSYAAGDFMAFQDVAAKRREELMKNQ